MKPYQRITLFSFLIATGLLMGHIRFASAANNLGGVNFGVSDDGGQNYFDSVNVNDEQDVKLSWQADYDQAEISIDYTSGCDSNTNLVGGSKGGSSSGSVDFGVDNCNSYTFTLSATDPNELRPVGAPPTVYASASVTVSVNPPPPPVVSIPPPSTFPPTPPPTPPAFPPYPDPPQVTSTNTDFISSQPEDPVYPSSDYAYSAGALEIVPEGYALTAIGYGSDDHKCVMGIQTAPVNSDGVIDFGNVSGLMQNVCSVPPRQGPPINRNGYEVQFPFDSGRRPYVVTGWSWGAKTSGGNGDDDTYPALECFYQEYTNVKNLSIIYGWGDQYGGSCQNRGYLSGWLKDVIRAPAGQVIVGIDFNLDNDARLRFMAQTIREVHPEIQLNQTSLNFSSSQGSNPASQNLTITNVGWGQYLNWTSAVVYDQASTGWLSLSPNNGRITPGQSADTTLSINTNGLAAGTYTATVTITDPNAYIQNRSMFVTLTVAPVGSSTSNVDLTANNPNVNFTDGNNTAIASISGQINNTGSGDINSAFPNRIEIDLNNNGIVDSSYQQSLPSLGAGTSDTVTFSNAAISSIPPGNHATRLCADMDTSGNGVIDESDEADNCSGWTLFTVSTPGGCTDNSTISISQGLPATMDPGQVAPITLRVTNTGNTVWYDANVYQLRQLGSGISIVSTAPSGVSGLDYGRLTGPISPGGFIDWTFNVTAPTTPSNYTLQMRMQHAAGSEYRKTDSTVCGSPGSDTRFGATASDSFTVNVISSGGIGFSIVYTAKPINPVDLNQVTLDNSTCGQITLSWSYTSNGAEDGFNVYRSENPPTIPYAFLAFVPKKNPATNSYSYTDSSATVGTTYHYIVRTHRALAIAPQESAPSNDVSAMDISCNGNLSQSSKKLLMVGATPYDPLTDTPKIKENDLLTYQITVINSGPSSVVVNYICDTPSSNLQGITTHPITVSGNGSSGNGTLPVGGGVDCGSSNIKFKVSGTKPASPPEPTNWVITYQGVFHSTSPLNPQEPISNRGSISYTDGTGTYPQPLPPTSYLVNTSKSKVPLFREVAP